MTVFVIRNGELVEKSVAQQTDAPYVITDEMSPTRHMATGKYFTSKRKFRDETKASGCVEIGNDSSLTRPRKPIPLDRGKRREDIRKALYSIRNGYNVRKDNYEW